MSVLTARRNESLELSPFQQRVCAVPEQFNIFLGGGRGGAKSHAMAFLALRHAAQRMQRSTSSASVPISLLRPLSKSTTWKFSGPSFSFDRRGPLITVT